MRAPVLALGLILSGSIPAFAYTQADASACMWDAFRFCSAEIPDAHRVADCLYAKRPQLSTACSHAFARNLRVRAHRRHVRSVVIDD